MSTPKPSIEARTVCVVGGLLSSLPGKGVTAAGLRAAGSRLVHGSTATVVGVGSVGLFGSGIGHLLEESEHVWAVADMDLVNLEDLHAGVGLEPGDRRLLTRLYLQQGPKFVQQLRGAFALALYDRRLHQLLLAGDHFGQRRLHYTSDGGQTAFASRLEALLAIPGVEKRVDRQAMYDYLNFRFVPAPETAFEGIRRLPPGHLLLVRQGHSETEPFWDMTYSNEASREDRATSNLYRLTHQAVADAVKGLDPKRDGAFLSGGTDSTTVVALMTRIVGEPVNAFSIGFNEQRYDELHYAALAARHFGAAHHTRIVTPDDALAALPRLIEAYDEPFGNNSALGTFFCAQLARECGVTRLLAGDGGDEIFGGNERYRMDRIFGRYGRLPRVLRRGLLEPLLLSLPDRVPHILSRARNYIRRANIPNPRRFYSYEFYVAQNVQDVLHDEFIRDVAADAPWTILEGHFRRVRADAELDRLLYLDLKLTIGDNDLLKVTRTAGLAGVGVRFPLLALPLVEFTGTLPPHFKVRGLEKRYLFRRAFRTLLPPETLAKQKHGFGVPTAEWLKNHRGFRELARDTLLSPRAAQRGYFRAGAIESMFALHATDSTPYYGDILWAILMLELWHRCHVDRAGAV